jgi:hypothetical protein
MCTRRVAQDAATVLHLDGVAQEPASEGLDVREQGQRTEG